MTARALIFTILAAAITATAAYFCGVYAVRVLERETVTTVNASLHAAGNDWARVEADGLRVVLSGNAPSEPARFTALQVTGRVIDTSRIIDQITINSAVETPIPDFQLSIVRNDGKLSLIGLIPTGETRDMTLRALQDAAQDSEFSDLMESVDHDAPQNWPPALSYALAAAARLDRAQITVLPGAVDVTAFLNSEDLKAEFEASMARMDVADVAVTMTLTAPKPVIAPFAFAALKSEEGLEVQACTVDTQEVATQVQEKLAKMGGESECVVALGAPSPQWGAAIIASLDTLEEFDSGAVEILDADITVTGPIGGGQDQFDAALVKLADRLPRIFSLEAVLPPPPPSGDEIERPIARVFSADLNPESGVTLLGPLRDKTAQDAVRNYAFALFGFDAVIADTSADTEVADGWTQRVLTALDALNELHEGQLFVHEDRVIIRGTAIEETAQEVILAHLATHLPDTEINHSITYKPEIKRLIEAPSPEECQTRLSALLEGSQIVFAPNSADISGESGLLLDEIAEVILTCPNAQFEIGGHTDSQGREAMNLSLSQARAEAVLDSLLARDVLLDFVTAKGYGESQPIASNDDEAGRATNRRIEIKLLPAVEDGDGAITDVPSLDETGTSGAEAQETQAQETSNE